MSMLSHDQLRACHWLLLRVAGHVPDHVLTRCRQLVADRRPVDVGREVADTALARRIALTVADVNVLAELLVADSHVLSMVDVTDADVIPACGFVAGRAQLEAAITLGDEIRPGVARPDPRPEDDVDRAALGAVADDPAIRALWRVWRYPIHQSAPLEIRRMYLIECDSEADLITVTATKHATLADAGEIDPQVEVYPTRADLPRYHRLARASGALLWAREPDPGIRIARLYDVVDDAGPRMEPGHETIDDPEAGRLVAYL